MNNFLTIFLLSCSLVPSSLFSQNKNPVNNKQVFRYTKAMLQEDVRMAAEEFQEKVNSYDKLPAEQKKETPYPVPMAIKKSEKDYLMIVVGEGKSQNLDVAKDRAVLNCDNNLIKQFIYKNKKVSELTKDKNFDIKITSNADNLVDLSGYQNENYKLKQDTKKEVVKTNKRPEEYYISKYPCATPLRFYISPDVKDPIAIIYY